MNISHLTNEQRMILAAANEYSLMLYGKNPRKRERWVRSTYAEELAAAAVADDELMAVLQACAKWKAAYDSEREACSEKELAVFDETTRIALRDLLNEETFPEIKVDGNDVHIITACFTAYQTVLTLKNVDGVPEDIRGRFCYELSLWRKDDNRFCLSVFVETQETFEITFDTAEANTTIYNACRAPIVVDSAWWVLHTVCFEILKKYTVSETLCNEKEKALIPLIREITATRNEKGLVLLPTLKTLTKEYNCWKAYSLVCQAEAFAVDDTKFGKTWNKLELAFCDIECEALWRHIYHRLEDSQAAYPDEIYGDKEFLAAKRREIQALMEARGYVGEYPNFVKNGAMNGLHLERSYNVTYTVGWTKRAVYYVHCRETFSEDSYLSTLAIQFCCGTALLKKGEDEPDIYSCLFNARGRRFFRTVLYCTPIVPAGENVDHDDWVTHDDLETTVTIAAKKAECLKLNKAEKREYYAVTMSGFRYFMRIFLIAGGLFGTLMTAAYMIITALVAVIFGSAAEIPFLLTEIPWLFIFAFSWIGFGGAMGIIETLASRK